MTNVLLKSPLHITPAPEINSGITVADDDSVPQTSVHKCRNKFLIPSNYAENLVQ
jgi:hypothetical protein